MSTRALAPALLVAALALAGCSSSPFDEPASGASAPAGSTGPAATQGPSGSGGDTEGWATTTPAAAGFRPARLETLARAARRTDSTCFAVVRDDELVMERNWGTDRDEPREVFSVSKSVTSALVGIAVRDGSLRLDDRVSRWVPAWRGTDSAGVTVRQLLSNTSGRFWSSQSDYVRLVQGSNRTAYAVGLGQQFPPGSTWAYNNAAIQVLDRVLSKATGMPTDELAQERLFGPLGMDHTSMTRDVSDRSTNTFFGVRSTCLDLLRFARLYLDGGRSEDGRLLSTDYVQASVGRSSSDLNAAYGFLWWVNRDGVQRGAVDAVGATGQPLVPRTGRLVPGAPDDLFAALGLGGQVALVDPGSRTLVVRLGALPRDEAHTYRVGDAARVVTQALRR